MKALNRLISRQTFLFNTASHRRSPLGLCSSSRQSVPHQQHRSLSFSSSIGESGSGTGAYVGGGRRWKSASAAARKEVEAEDDGEIEIDIGPQVLGGREGEGMGSIGGFREARSTAGASSSGYRSVVKTAKKPSTSPSWSPNSTHSPATSASRRSIPPSSPATPYLDTKPKNKVKTKAKPPSLQSHSRSSITANSVSLPESTLLPPTSLGDDDPDLFGFHLEGDSFGAGEISEEGDESAWQGEEDFDFSDITSTQSEHPDSLLTPPSPSLSPFSPTIASRSGADIGVDDFDPLHNLQELDEIAEAASEYARSSTRLGVDMEVGLEVLGGMGKIEGKGEGKGKKGVRRKHDMEGTQELESRGAALKRQLERASTAVGDSELESQSTTESSTSDLTTLQTESNYNHTYAQSPFPSQSRFDWRQRATSRLRAEDRRKRVFKFRDLRKPRKGELGRGEGRWKEEVGAYTDKWLSLLTTEQQAAESQAEERLKRSTKEVLVWQGFCLDRLGGSWEKPKFSPAGVTQSSGSGAGGEEKVKGRRVAVFANSGRKGTSGFRWNRLQPGAVVRLSRDSTDFQDTTAVQEGDDSSKPTLPPEPIITGTVNKQEVGKIYITLEGDIPDLERELWRLDLWISDIVLRRSVEALASLNHDPVVTDSEGISRQAALRETMVVMPPSETGTSDEANPSQIPQPARKVSATEQVLRGTALRDLLVGPLGRDAAAQAKPEDQVGMFSDDMLIMSWCRRHLRKGKDFLPVEGDPDVKLNESQKRAIALMLSRRLSLIQGPPGTGKTRTIIEALHLLKAHWQVSAPILVTGYTNTAVDNLAEGLRQRKLKILRYGAASRIREDLQPVSLEGYLERHSKKRTLDMIKQKLALLPRTPEAANERLKLRNRLFGLERYMMQDILNNVDIVCATCISAVSGLLQMIDFPVVFLDEASMATEPASLIPLTKGCAHLAIIGDQKQLPPVILSQDAKDSGLALSLFERLMKASGSDHRLPSSLLDTQYRMHPVISAFPNKAFYDGQLQDGTVLPDGTVRRDLVPPSTAFLDPSGQGSLVPMTFIDHASPEKPHMGSINNVGEVDIVASIVVDILQGNPHVNVGDIGIISPYSAQVMALQQLLHDPGKAAMWADLIGQKRIDNLSNLEISTVDGFEGREKRIIIFSTTRSNPRFAIGFLEDNRRLNVALTRAQAALIIVGNARTLRNAQSFSSTSKGGVRAWHTLIAHLQKSKLIIPYDNDNTTQQS